MPVIPNEFLSLDLESLEQIEAWFIGMATLIGSRVRQKRDLESLQARGAARADFLATAPEKVLALLERGYNSRESAIEATAREMNLPGFAVEAQFREFLKSRDRAAREKRDRIIVDLVRAGLSNEDIADRLKIHRNTVSRAISGHLFPHLRPVDRARLKKRRLA